MASNMVYLGFAEHPEDFQTSAVQSHFFFLHIAAWLPGSTLLRLPNTLLRRGCAADAVPHTSTLVLISPNSEG